MLKKRIIGVVTVKDNLAVQSFGFNRYLPLGDPILLVENLDNWGADEIFLQVIDRSKNNSGPHLSLIQKVADMGLSTPLIYGGGINNLEAGIDAISNGADRIVVDHILKIDANIVRDLSYNLGTQAIIGCLAIGIIENKIQLFDYIRGRFTEINESIINIIDNKIVSEVLIIDCQNEGKPNSFNDKLIDHLPFDDPPLILFGGISSPLIINQLLLKKNVQAVGIGNFLNYKEDSIFLFKKLINKEFIRI